MKNPRFQETFDTHINSVLYDAEQLLARLKKIAEKKDGWTDNKDMEVCLDMMKDISTFSRDASNTLRSAILVTCRE